MISNACWSDTIIKMNMNTHIKSVSWNNINVYANVKPFIFPSDKDNIYILEIKTDEYSDLNINCGGNIKPPSFPMAPLG